ncbi:MAG: laccase domain-containing protein, partial [Bacilli bacterium]|nr:laccase domain-containing protein [Bacilli bacterium]
DCHEITLEEFLDYYNQDKTKQENTIWNIEKNYTAIFMTKDTHDKLKQKVGRSVSLVYPAADCAIVRYYDKKKNVIGLTHSNGWYTGENLVGKMTDYMKNHFRSNLEDIEVYVGAFAHSDWIYNGIPPFVGKQLEDGSIEYRGEWKKYIEKLDQNKIKINYGDLLYKQIIESGISNNNLYFSKENTLFEKDYYSHARSMNTKEKEGRNLFGISFDVENIINHKEENGTILR